MQPPPDPLFDRARALDARGDAEGAAELYRRVIDSDSSDYRARNNLGLILAAKGDLAAALHELRTALDDDPEQPLICYNLGNVLQRLDDAEGALSMYERCLGLGSRTAEVYYNMASTLEILERPAEAERAYREALELAPGDHRVVSNLGALLLRQDRTPEALGYFRRAVELFPDSALDHFNVAKILDDRGEISEAAEAYRRSLTLNPAADSCRYRLIAMLQRSGQNEAARVELEQWIERFPDSATARHMYCAFHGDRELERASAEYIEETFDGFADSFDQTLARLRYRAPQLIAEALERELGPPASALTVLDAGCGTGLSGLAIADWAYSLIGVDLSEEMLAKAAPREVYSELVRCELEEYLGRHEQRFDAIICADTLCYFGALERVIGLAGQALRADGVLAFTLEAAEEAIDAGYRLLPHGRFRHDPDYVRRLLAEAGLETRSLDFHVLRTEAGRPVAGMIVLARRRA